MSNTAEQQRLAELIREKIDEERKRVGEVETWGWSTWNERNRDADKRLVAFFESEEGARCTYTGQGYRVRLAGRDASSTSGYQQALLNWRATTLKRLAAQDVAA